jgi:hypothetical protein
MKRKGHTMKKNASWLMGLFALAMMVLVACGVEPAQEPQKEDESAQPADHATAESDVRISAFTDVVEVQAACSPVGASEACCPYPSGCSCLGIRDCLPTGMWSRCLGAGRAGEPCP